MGASGPTLELDKLFAIRSKGEDVQRAEDKHSERLFRLLVGGAVAAFTVFVARAGPVFEGYGRRGLVAPALRDETVRGVRGVFVGAAGADEGWGSVGGGRGSYGSLRF